MAHKTLRLEIVGAEKMLFSSDVQHLEVTGASGELGIHPGHTPLLTHIKPGNVVAVCEDGTQEIFYVSGGMLEVQPRTVTVLADTASRADDLDEVAVQSAKARAERVLEDQQGETNYAQALAELAEAAAQLRAIAALKRLKR